MKKEIEDSFHDVDIIKTLNKLNTNKDGLSEEDAKKRLIEYGPNELREGNKFSPLIVFIKQFHSFFVYILIVAALISYIIGNYIDMYVIIGVIVINSSIGFFQEYKAERAISALKKMIVLYAKVFRDKELLKIKASELVPGDIILLEEGDKIPADARLIWVKDFQTIEASLTGESMPVVKKTSSLKRDISIGDRVNMAWMGTFVASGTAKAVVVATGNNTVIGNIALDIADIKKEKSHFKKKSDTLAMSMGLIAISISIIIFIIGFFIRGFNFIEISLFTIAALVAGIPEGLPAVLIIVLAIGSYKMSKRNAIIRSLPATETLAVVNTIISDKTGTLTENTMTIKKILLSGEKEVDVTGQGWESVGSFIQEKDKVMPSEKYALNKLLHIAGLCNNSKLIKEKEGEHEEFKIIGDPTEASLVVLSEKAGLKKEELLTKKIKVDDIPFNQEKRFRASLIKLVKEKNKEIYVVGAPEVVLKESSSLLRLRTEKKMTILDRKEIEKQINILTKNAMRVIALAYKKVSYEKEKISIEEVNNLTFVGLVGMIDPPREGVKEAIAKARKSGIRIIMATGDHLNTAVAIAKEIGIDSSKAFSEEDLKKLNDDDFEKAAREVNVFARLSPHMKMRIAETLQKRGDVVAMTGDGVNDAPALKKADIGIAMGIIGTDVARESSEIILADDNFATIINAIEEGRIVFNNTRQTSFFLITTNFAEGMVIITSLVAGFPLPLLPTQILWLNLVTDTGPALGLAAEPGHISVAEEKPKNPKENILTKAVVPYLILISFIMVILTILTFIYYLPYGIDKARSGAFVVMALTQLFSSINFRSLNKSLNKIGFMSNKNLLWMLFVSFGSIVLILYVPFFQNLFGFGHLKIVEFAFLLIISSSIFWLAEGYKKISRRTQ